MINNLNEIIIFFLIIIFIILSYYDVKYSIIFSIVLGLLYIYSNKLLEKSEKYTHYNENIDSIFNQLHKYSNNDIQSYNLGLKYYKYFMNNIKLLYNVDDYIKFKSLLDNSKVYLDTSIDNFNSILFSINTYDKGYEKEFVNLINMLKTESNNVLKETKNKYNDIKKCYDEENNNYNIFCDNDPQIQLFTEMNVKPEIYNEPIEGLNMFNRVLDDKRFKENECRKPHLLFPINHHAGNNSFNERGSMVNNIDTSKYRVVDINSVKISL